MKYLIFLGLVFVFRASGAGYATWGREFSMRNGMIEPINTLPMLDGSTVVVFQFNTVDVGSQQAVYYILLIKVSENGDLLWRKAVTFYDTILENQRYTTPDKRRNIKGYRSDAVINDATNEITIGGFIVIEQGIESKLVFKPFLVTLYDDGTLKNRHLFGNFALEDRFVMITSKLFLSKDKSVLMANHIIDNEAVQVLLSKISSSGDKVLWRKEIKSNNHESVGISNIFEEEKYYHLLGVSTWFDRSNNYNETFTSHFTVDSETGDIHQSFFYRDDFSDDMKKNEEVSPAMLYQFTQNTKKNGKSSSSFWGTHDRKIFEFTADGSILWCKTVFLPLYDNTHFIHTLFIKRIEGLEEENEFVVTIDDADFGYNFTKYKDLMEDLRDERNDVLTQQMLRDFPVLGEVVDNLMHSRAHIRVSNFQQNHTFLIKFDRVRVSWARVFDNVAESTKGKKQQKLFGTFDLDVKKKIDDHGFILTSHFHDIEKPILSDNTPPEKINEEIRKFLRTDVIVYTTDPAGVNNNCGLRDYAEKTERIILRDCDMVTGHDDDDDWVVNNNGYSFSDHPILPADTIFDVRIVDDDDISSVTITNFCGPYYGYLMVVVMIIGFILVIFIVILLLLGIAVYVFYKKKKGEEEDPEITESSSSYYSYVFSEEGEQEESGLSVDDDDDDEDSEDSFL